MFGARILLAMAVMSHLAAPAAAQPDPVPGWRMHWANEHCTLARAQDSDTPFTLAFRTLPGLESVSLFLARGNAILPPQSGTVTLAPSGRSFELSVGYDYRVGGSRLPLLGNLPGDFLDALAASDELQFSKGSEVVARIHLTGTAAAVAALRRCVSDALRQWGVEEVALSALRRRPVGNDYVSANDYPDEAVRRHIQGRVIMRILVSAEGRPTACVPVVASPARILDDAACNAVLRRARYTPALDAAGQPTAAPVISAVGFFMP